MPGGTLRVLGAALCGSASTAGTHCFSSGAEHHPSLQYTIQHLPLHQYCIIGQGKLWK